MPYTIFGLICVGLLGASLFTSGIIFGMMPLVASGIAILALSIMAMLLYYIYCQQPSVQGQGAIQIHGAVAYTTNNMNTMKRQPPLQPSAFSTKRNPIIAEGNNTLMLSAFSTKRNKSDTDLELMSQQTDV